MMSLATFYLFSITIQFIAVKSLKIPSAIDRNIISASPRRSINFCLTKVNDENGGVENEIDFDWKSIASYVFDETIDSTDILRISQCQDSQDVGDSQSIKNQIPHQHSKPIILFDGICNLCNGGVNFAIDHDKTGKFRFASLQSNVAKSLLIRDGKDPCTTSDIVLVTSEKTYYSSEAVARIMAGLDMPFLKVVGVLGQITPSFARNAIYRVVSGNRFILGENDSCRMDFDGEYTSRFVSDPPETIVVDARKEDEENQ